MQNGWRRDGETWLDLPESDGVLTGNCVLSATAHSGDGIHGPMAYILCLQITVGAGRLTAPWRWRSRWLAK